MSGDSDGGNYAPLRHTPYPVKRALLFCAATHRRRPRLQGALWAIAAWRGDVVVGVAIVARPARMLDDCRTLVVARVAVIEGDASQNNGNKGVCSLLYASCSRAVHAMGATALYTYTDLDEPGISLRAAGWHDDGETKGGEWNRPSRQRALAINADPKRRWRTPWSPSLRDRKGGDMSEWPEDLRMRQYPDV